MEISLRLEKIASMVEKCECIADIGTDHAYIPIYLIKNGKCETAIASDINKGPVEKAKLNIQLEDVQGKIQCRLGGGLSTIRAGEVQCAIIAGMGGNLIRDILEEGIDIYKKMDYVILQPVQNPEVLRKYIYENGFNILDEEICIDENKFYEIIKVKYDNKPQIKDSIFYEISENLIHKKHPLIGAYIELKLEKYNKIYNNIKDTTELALHRKEELSEKIIKMKELLACI